MLPLFDAAFHVVARLLGDDVAQDTAHYIEYAYWQPGLEF